MRLRTGFAITLAVFLGVAGQVFAAEQAPPLVLERTIPLEGVSGRIDHMAVDLRRARLMVAELGNGTVDVIDRKRSQVVHRFTGLKEPQGVAYVPRPLDLIVVASAGDGMVRLFHAGDFAPAGSVALGDDADNVRIDPSTGDVVVGFGTGGLAIIDPARAARIGTIRLAAHPESFRLDERIGRAFVNVPDARQIAVVDLRKARQVSTWRVLGLSANFPMALDSAASALATVFRSPPRLVLLDTRSGAVTASLATCGDADDVFFDDRRQRVYVSCGAGAIDVFRREGRRLHPLARVATRIGARTSLFVPELGRLFVAARAGPLRSGAAILVFRTAP